MQNEPIYIIGYARISDASQLKGDGLKNQRDAISEFVTRNGWTLFPDNKIHTEVYTGTTQNRPIYQQLLQLIKENPNKVKYFVIRSIDRSSREGSQVYLQMKEELASLGVQLRDTAGVIQSSVNTLGHRGVEFSWSNFSPSRIAEIITAEGAKDERSRILTRTVDTSIHRVESGYKLRESQYGYKNEVVIGLDGKQKTIQVRNEPEALYIEAIFEKTAEGVMSEQEIVDYVNSLGYKSRSRKKWDGKKEDRRVISIKEGKRLDVKQMQRYRKNPIYCGVNIEKWGDKTARLIISKTQYKGLVSIEKFNLANKGKVYVEEVSDDDVKVLYDLKLDKIIKKRQKFRKEYVFKNVVLCDVCKAPLCASPSRGKSGKQISYYHCAREHKRFAPSQKDMDRSMMTFLSTIKFNDKYYSIFEKVLTQKYKGEQEKCLDTQIALNKNILSLQNELKLALDAYKTASNPNMKKQYEEEYSKLEDELIVARVERQKLELDYDDLSNFLKYARNLMEHPIEMFLNVATYNEQMAVYKILFLEFPTYSEVVNGTPKISLIFKVGMENRDEKSLAVTLRGIEPRLQE